MKPDEQRTSDNSLDATIREALRVETDPLCVARLERYWRRRSQREVRRQRAVRLIPLAAAAILAFAMFFLTHRGNQGNRGDIAQVQRNPPRALESNDAHLPIAQTRPNETDEAMSAALAGREPTAYERFVLAARSSARESVQSRRQRIEEAVHQLAGGELDPEKVFSASGVDAKVAETILLRKLPRSAGAEQAAILKLLRVCGSQRSIPALARLGRNQALSEEVLRVIQDIAGSAGLVQAAVSESTSQLRMAAMLRLLSSDSEESLLAYLSLVSNAATRNSALAAAAAAPEVPIPRLLDCLDAVEMPVRLSAATVLGHVNGPQITELLIARISENPANSTEAWLALMSCRGEAAAEFLAYASYRPQLLGHLNNARVRWALMIP